MTMDENFFGDMGKYTLNTLDQAAKTAELFRLKNELSELMYRHVKDCAAILTQMEYLVEELKDLEFRHVEQTKNALERDLKLSP